MLRDKCTPREPTQTTSTFSMAQHYGEIVFQDVCEVLCSHRASSIDFTENYSYGEHLNSKRDASKLLMQFMRD